MQLHPTRLLVAGLLLTGPLHAQVSLTPFSGAPGEGFGSAVATGDIDADGATDVAVGAPTATDTTGTTTGRVDVFFGSGATASLFPSGAGTAGAEFGAVLALGDLDGVPGDELVVGAPGQATSSGNHYVFDAPAISAGIPIRQFGGLVGDRLGTSVTVFPHPIVPGTAAWAAGAPGGNLVGATSGSGYVDVHDLPSGPTFLTFYGPPPVPPTAMCSLGISGLMAVTGPREFGRRLVGGDFDGDGLGDLAATGWSYWVAGGGTGAQCLAGPQMWIHTSDGSTTPYTFSTSFLTVRELGGSSENDIAAIGDIDGDGSDELLHANWAPSISSPYLEIVGGTQRRDVPNASLLMPAAGDLDRDGIGDVVLHSTVGSSRTFDWLSTDTTGLLDMVTETVPVSPVAAMAMDDVNGDGFTDLVYGSPSTAEVRVTSPADPSSTLTVFDDQVSASTTERLLFYVDGSSMGVAPGDLFTLLASSATAPGVLSFCGLSGDLVPNGVFSLSLSSPALFFETGTGLFDPDGRFVTGRTYVPPAPLGPSLVGVTLFYQFAAYSPPLACIAASSVDSMTIVP